MSKWNLLVFGVYPYVALAICLLGSWARFDLSQYTWKAGSSQMLNNRGMRVASNFFHIGVLFVLAGHFVGLLTPASVYHHVISTEHKQLLAMVSGGVFGLLCLVGLLMLVKRRLGDPRVRATSSCVGHPDPAGAARAVAAGLADHRRLHRPYGRLGDGDARRLGAERGAAAAEWTRRRRSRRSA